MGEHWRISPSFIFSLLLTHFQTQTYYINTSHVWYSCMLRNCSQGHFYSTVCKTIAFCLPNDCGVEDIQGKEEGFRGSRVESELLRNPELPWHVRSCLGQVSGTHRNVLTPLITRLWKANLHIYLLHMFPCVYLRVCTWLWLAS